ncbi:mRNA export factor GLE1 [Petromyzon marinus]|uniref:mRNA export factor GLE1 n=1 Tax=Petromyzon marinus TaxID=7757 RepID=UPI003F707F07
MDAMDKKWDVLGALRNSAQGKLRYERKWSPEVLTEVVPTLSPLAGRVLDLVQQRSQSSPDEEEQSRVSILSPLTSPRSPPLINCQDLIIGNRSGGSCIRRSDETIFVVSMPEDPAEIEAQIRSQEEMYKMRTKDLIIGNRSGGSCIRRCDETIFVVSMPEDPAEIEAQIRSQEEMYKMRTKVLLHQRCKRLEAAECAMQHQATQQFKRYEEELELEQRLEQERRKDELDKSLVEAQKKLEKIMEEHQDRTKVLNIRLHEAAEQHRREEEEERRRLAEGHERARRLNALQEEMLALNRRAQPSPPQPGTAATAAGAQSGALAQLAELRMRAGQLCDTVATAIRNSSDSGGFGPSPQDLAHAEQVLAEMRLLAVQVEALRLQEERRLEAEKGDAQRLARELQQQQQHQQQQQEQAEQQKRQQKEEEETRNTNQVGLQRTDSSILSWSKELQVKLDETMKNMDDLNSSKDPKIKAIKFELAKAVSTPVSQICSTSGSHLYDITGKLNSLLSSQTIEVGNRSISVSRHPQGLLYAQYKLGEKLVKQGEEEVASQHKAAFPIAAVAISLWDRHPALGELLLAHMHRKCPYTVPVFNLPTPGQNQEDFFRSLGYCYDGKTLEKQDLFLNRMSGMMRLYAAIIATPVPSPSMNKSHPHGLQYGWRWIAQMLNLEPVSDISATMLYDFLEVAGNAMERAYCSQFWKLLFFIIEEYLPRIEKVSSPAQMGSVSRLKLFVERCIARRVVPQASGYLSESFWKT